jgi:hypothetical protein
MKSQRAILSMAGLAVIALTAYFLTVLRDHQRLGQPGVRVGHFPVYDENGKLLSEDSVLLPEAIGGLGSRIQPISLAELSWLPKDTTFGRRVYTNASGFWAQVSVVLMRLDRTSIHKPEACLPGQGWIIEDRQPATVHLTDPRQCELPVQKITARIGVKNAKGETTEIKGLYVYWFVADGLVTESHFKRTLWLARDLIFKQVLDRWAYVSYFAPCQPGHEDQCFEQLKKLIAASAPAFQTSFPDPANGAQTASLGR